MLRVKCFEINKNHQNRINESTGKFEDKIEILLYR